MNKFVLSIFLFLISFLISAEKICWNCKRANSDDVRYCIDCCTDISSVQSFNIDPDSVRRVPDEVKTIDRLISPDFKNSLRKVVPAKKNNKKNDSLVIAKFRNQFFKKIAIFIIIIFFILEFFFLLRKRRFDIAWENRKKHFYSERKSKEQLEENSKNLEIFKSLKILGLTDLASKKIILNAYKTKLKELHPDKFIGSPPEIQREMAQKLEEVHLAYNNLKNCLYG